MPNRIELQDKGKGCGRNPNTGLSDGKGASDKGIRVDIRRHKRDEAERRNFLTPEHLRRQYWKAQGYSRMSAWRTKVKARDYADYVGVLAAIEARYAEL